jgi:competence/damage-inducible protein CinA-like protein
MNAEIIAIGSELLLGETIDTNSAYLAQQLAATGINLFRKTVVGDNQDRIAATIAEALDRADLVVCTGGLGPTVDDMTREAVAQAVNRPLEFHQHLLDQIEARFRAFGRTMSESNRRQAYVPEGSRIVENPRGTAPPFIVEEPRGTIVVLPGVPAEMRYLWENAIQPYLRDERGQTSVILVRTLYAAGTSESYLGEQIADLMEQPNPTLGISAKRGRFELRIGARANSVAEAEELVAKAEAAIRERAGQYLVGDETIEQSVVHILQQRGLTLALYEGTNQAPVYRALAALPAGRELLRGALIHPLDRPADDESARTLARAGAATVAEQWSAPLGLAIQPATEPGDDGFTFVAAALIHSGGISEWSRRFDLRLEQGWEFIGTMALDGLRQFLLNEHTV